MIRFVGILLLLVGYTAFKAWQMWPGHRLIAMALVLPLFVWMVGWMFIYRYRADQFDALWMMMLVFSGSLIMGIWTTFVLLSVPLDAVSIVASIISKFSPDHDSERRNFITNGIRFAVLAISGGFAGLGLIEMLKGPQVKQTKISHTKFPVTLNGLKIAQISDLHVGPTIQKKYVEDVVRKTNALEPDLIFITGDMADGPVIEMSRLLEPLENLRSKYGIFYVTGNHEYYWGAEDFIELMRSYGFTPLINESCIIHIQDMLIMISGVTDPEGGKFSSAHAPDLRKAMRSESSSDFKILLAHRPDTVIQAEPLEFDLQFSGHTHGGQFVPFNLLFPLAHHYYQGLNNHGNMQVYVNAGTGYWGPPNRLGIPSEISLITLFNEV